MSLTSPVSEKVQQRFWHASFTSLPVGTMLAPQPDFEARWHQESAGRILEDHRPSEALAHRDAVFICDNPQDCDNAGAHCEWLFEVRPEGGIERHDLEWATQIDRLMAEGASPDEPAIQTLIQNYWTGLSSDWPVWEYLAPGATVVAVEPF